jgi:hypothetical protein
VGLTGAAGPESLADWPLLTELQAIAAGSLCGPAERRRCRTAAGSFADWACAECREFLRPEAVSPWTWHLVFLYRLSRAGYPFKANDLPLETWLLVGMVRRVFEGVQRGRHAQR